MDNGFVEPVGGFSMFSCLFRFPGGVNKSYAVG